MNFIQQPLKRTVYTEYVKRLIDVVGAILLFTLSSWIIVIILLLYVLTWEHPFYFFQQRIGKDGKAFLLIKFRSLKAGAGDVTQRRFWLGDLLRYLSWDELLQVYNVMKGDMSLVGPRPLPLEYLHLFSEEQNKRHQIRPGITGWAQINGRNSISWKKKFELDLYYVEHCSFFLDLKIIFKTILLLLSFKKDISLEESKFTGNNE